MPKRSFDSDDSEYTPPSSSLPKKTKSPKKTRTPKTPRTRRISSNASLNASENQTTFDAITTPKRRNEGRVLEQGSSPSKEAEEILAQCSPGTSWALKKSDLKRLQATHEERRQEALLKVEKQKQVIEERRNEIFFRLSGIGYKKSLIERDRYDHIKARTRWWQLVEDPQELTEQEWEKIRPDLCVILDRRKEAVRAIRAQTGSATSSSPLRPKSSPTHHNRVQRPNPNPTTGSTTGSNSATFSGKRALQEEVDDIADDDNETTDPLPAAGLRNLKNLAGSG